MPQPLILVGPHESAPPAPLMQPSTSGYLHLAAVVDPPRQPGPPFPRPSARRSLLLSRLPTLARGLDAHPDVQRTTIYRAVLVPPAPRGQGVAAARADVVVLVETVSPERTGGVQASAAYQSLTTALAEVAREVHVTTAGCLRRVAEVDKTRPGLFLFNYFTAPDAAVAVQLWERLAGWYAAHTGLDNSTVLAPTGETDFVFVNHARWDTSLPRFLARQFLKRSFWTFVRANLNANRVVARPVLYRLA